MSSLQADVTSSHSKFSIARLKYVLLLLCLVTCFFAFTPELAAKGAPFARFEQLEIALNSCGIHLIGFSFCQEIEDDKFIQTKCLCTNENALATAAHCYLNAYPDQIHNFISMCNLKYDVQLTRSQFDDAVNFYNDHAKLEPKPQGPPNAPPLFIDHPLKLNDTKVFVYREMYDMFLGNYNRSIVYGFYLSLFWAVVLAMAAMGNWTKILFPKFCNRFTGRRSAWIRKKITLPALFGRYKTNEKPFLKIFDLLVPTRAETLILVAFSILVIFLTFHNIHYVEGDPFYNKKMALLRYYAIRTGILGSYLLPFSVLFAGRNNILQWITRWEYATFVTFHRWISRIMVILILIHSNNYAVMLHGKMSKKLREPFVLWGVFGTYCGIIILIQALLVLRRRWYEAFLVLHILLALGYVVGSWIHVRDLYFLWFFYCSAWLWFSDRIIRLYRLATFGFPIAEVELFEDRTLKVSVKKPEGFEAEGGGHCFLHFLQWHCFWQSHPFTYTVVGEDIVFYVKVKEGVTLTLEKFLESNPKKTAHIRVAVEGSYGEATPASRYDSGVYIAGGNGIPGIFAEAIEAAETLEHDSTRKVKLIWVVREYHSLLWFYHELLSLKDSAVEVEIYVTRPTNRLNPPGKGEAMALLHNTYTHELYLSSSDVDDPVKQLKKDLEHVEFKEGRPDIPGIVTQAVKESPGSVAFVTCGHPIMVDDLRHEVVQVLGKNSRRVDFFEQLQVWA